LDPESDDSGPVGYTYDVSPEGNGPARNGDRFEGTIIFAPIKEVSVADSDARTPAAVNPALFGGVDVARPLNLEQEAQVSKWITSNTRFVMNREMGDRLAAFRHAQALAHWRVGNYGAWLFNRILSNLHSAGCPQCSIAAVGNIPLGRTGSTTL